LAVSREPPKIGRQRWQEWGLEPGRSQQHEHLGVSRGGPFNWPVLGVVGLVSLIIMPATAVWFLFLGFLALMGTAIYAALPRAKRTIGALATGASIGVGLLVGPVVYLSLAALT
jgi:hypothetical protein